MVPHALSNASTATGNRDRLGNMMETSEMSANQAAISLSGFTIILRIMSVDISPLKRPEIEGSSLSIEWYGEIEKYPEKAGIAIGLGVRGLYLLDGKTIFRAAELSIENVKSILSV
jgi:hypothetical protein